MDKSHDDGNRGTPAIRRLAALTVPFSMFSKDRAEIIDILWLLRGTTGKQQRQNETRSCGKRVHSDGPVGGQTPQTSSWVINASDSTMVTPKDAAFDSLEPAS